MHTYSTLAHATFTLMTSKFSGTQDRPLYQDWLDCGSARESAGPTMNPPQGPSLLVLSLNPCPASNESKETLTRMSIQCSLSTSTYIKQWGKRPDVVQAHVVDMVLKASVLVHNVHLFGPIFKKE